MFFSFSSVDWELVTVRSLAKHLSENLTPVKQVLLLSSMCIGRLVMTVILLSNMLQRMIGR